MASVTVQKRPNGRFGVRLNRDDGGTTWVGTFDLRRDAKAAGHKALADHRAGRSQAPAKVTLERYWLDTLLPLYVEGNEKLADGTKEAKKMIFRAYILPDAIARLPLSRITHDDVRRLQVRLTKRTTLRRGPMSAGTVNNVLIQLSWAFNQARRRGMLAANPCQDVPRLHEDHAPYFLSDTERERLLHCFRLEQDARLADFICETGLRKGEALGITISQVGEVPLELTRQLRPNCTHGPLKNRRRRRVGLSEHAQALMRDQLAWLRREYLRHGRGAPLPGDLLWPGRRLGPLRRDTWDSALNQAAETARLPLTTHDLRHTYAAMMIDGGLDIYTLARQLGDSLSVTERIYAHLYPESHQRAAEILDRRRAGKATPDFAGDVVARAPAKRSLSRPLARTR